MRQSLLRALLLSPILALAAQVAPAQETPPAAAPAEADCSRWPGAVFDPATGLCTCPEGRWWNLRGDACLPREHAAGEFCQTVWPASQPFFQSDGGYRCVCTPPLIWNSEATACRTPVTIGVDECTEEWPGTLPVLSPSGTEFECRCPAGRRWDERAGRCVEGAPVIAAPRPLYGDVPSEPPVLPGAHSTTGPAYPGSAPAPAFPTPPAGPPVPGAASRPPSPQCQGLLAEIRAAAAAGDAARGDALGMKAAIAGCDPVSISEAARVGAAGR